MTFKEIRLLSGMNQTEFSRFYGIPLRTIASWEADKEHSGRNPPAWLLPLLERLVRIDIEKKRPE